MFEGNLALPPMHITKVENGFVAYANSTQRVYTNFDELVADLKTYFGV